MKACGWHRENHVPVIFHVDEITQPQGHSTSGSHERYKGQERLAWEREWDCLKKMREWIIENALSNSDELEDIERNAKKEVKESKDHAWQNYLGPIKLQVEKTAELINNLAAAIPEKADALRRISAGLTSNREPLRRDVMKALYDAISIAQKNEAALTIADYYNSLLSENKKLYNTDLYNEGIKSALKVEEVKPQWDANTPVINGYEILNRYFDQLFSSNLKVVAFGEDLGQIGDVNQGFSGLQAKHGDNRIFDTGIRELTIIGQGIGLALRGLRPIAEIQYLDYLLYGLTTIK